jgi:hypothetical protein
MFRPALFYALLGLACAHRSPGRVAASVSDRTVRARPLAVKVTKKDLALAGLDDAALLAVGRNAVLDNDDSAALEAFGRLLEVPASALRGPAAFEAGLLLARRARFDEARTWFSRAVALFGADSSEGLDARFRLADAAYFDGDRPTATAMLQALATHPSLTEGRRLEATVKAAVCLAESDRMDDAEAMFRDAVVRLSELPAQSRSDGALEGRARFQLAELLRRRFEAAPITPESAGYEPLVAQLEAKCRLLLEAQDLYLRCIRLGHPEWATAAGYRIGALYGSLHDQLVAARSPSSLSDEEASVYREELASRLSVLVDKAAATWEKTIATADRVGATNALVEQARSDLARLRTSVPRENP